LPFNNIKWLSDYSRRWQLRVKADFTGLKSHTVK